MNFDVKPTFFPTNFNENHTLFPTNLKRNEPLGLLFDGFRFRLSFVFFILRLLARSSTSEEVCHEEWLTCLFQLLLTFVFLLLSSKNHKIYL